MDQIYVPLLLELFVVVFITLSVGVLDGKYSEEVRQPLIEKGCYVAFAMVGVILFYDVLFNGAEDIRSISIHPLFFVLFQVYMCALLCYSWKKLTKQKFVYQYMGRCVIFLLKLSVLTQIVTFIVTIAILL